MKHFFTVIFVFLLLILAACEEKQSEEKQSAQTTPSSSLSEKCGDGTCDAIEMKRGICPEDCIAQKETTGKPTAETTSTPVLEPSSGASETYSYEPVELEMSWITPITSRKISETEDSTLGITTSKYTVVNPTSGASLAVVVFAPSDASSSTQYPAVIIIPGGTGTKDSFAKDARQYAANGFIVLIFDADGRGESTGTEDYNGYIQQDGLFELYRFLSAYDGVDTNNIGLISFSYGVTMATGMLGRYQPGIKFYIEWEGPVNRYYTVVGCEIEADSRAAVRAGVTCDDDDYWLEREALRFVPYLSVDYFVIVQRADDHVQPTTQHAVDINNLAVQYLDWVRVNGPENAVNQEYTVGTLPVLEGISYKAEVLAYMMEIAGE